MIRAWLGRQLTWDEDDGLELFDQEEARLEQQVAALRFGEREWRNRAHDLERDLEAARADHANQTKAWHTVNRQLLAERDAAREALADWTGSFCHCGAGVPPEGGTGFCSQHYRRPSRDDLVGPVKDYTDQGGAPGMLTSSPEATEAYRRQQSGPTTAYDQGDQG